MNRTLPSNETGTVNLPPDAIDMLLQEHLAASTEQLTPSSGFVLSVMDAIHTQAVEPPPIAFPWRRVLPGAVAALGILVAFVLFIFMGNAGNVSSATQPHLIAALSSLTPVETAAAWTLLAGCLSLILAALSFRLANRRS